MAYDAKFMFVWAPIDRSIQFDEEAAWEFVESLLGVDYGYPVLLTGWIDTLKDNYPCRRSKVFFFLK